MTSSEAAKRLNLSEETVIKRAKLLKLNARDITENDLHRIRDYAPIAVAPDTSNNQQASPKEAKPSENQGSVSQRKSEAENIINAGVATGNHLEITFAHQQYENGTALGTIGAVHYLEGLTTADLTIRSEGLQDLINRQRSQIANLAADTYAPKSIQQIYSEICEVKVLPIL